MYNYFSKNRVYICRIWTSPSLIVQESDNGQYTCKCYFINFTIGLNLAKTSETVAGKKSWKLKRVSRVRGLHLNRGSKVELKPLLMWVERKVLFEQFWARKSIVKGSNTECQKKSFFNLFFLLVLLSVHLPQNKGTSHSLSRFNMI